MKYALIIGNNRYTDQKLAQLKAPAADSQALANVLGDKSIGEFDEVTPLINQTEGKVSRAISAFLASKRPDDLVLIYFSGHGVLDDRGRLFLALKDTQTGLLKSTAISSSFIADEMDSCRSKRQILILDCCHSGAFGRGVKSGEQKAVTATTFEGSGFGRVVLTASDSTQYALEGNQVIKQTELSLFTHFLLEGLQTGKADVNNDGYVSLDEWYDYTFTQVLSTTPTQVPHKWSYHQQGDLIIAKNPFVKKKAPELPEDLLRLLESPYSSVREVAVKELGVLLRSRYSEYTELARAALEKLAEDDSRTVSLAAIKQLSEREKSIEEENLALEKIAREKREREAAEKAAWEKSEREAAQRARQEKAEREAAEKALREKTRQDAIEKARRERQEGWTARKTALEHGVSTSWAALLLYIKRLKPKNSEIARKLSTRTIVALVGLIGVIIVAMLALQPGDLYFASDQGGKVEIYQFTNENTTRLTNTPGTPESWGPTGRLGALYFTSDRDGKMEIYELVNDIAKRVTHTPGNFESWGPAVSFGILYFTSDRDGKAEIYKLTNNRAVRVTHTPKNFESWGPAVSFGTLYFTSNRDGKAEIYKLTNNEAVRATHTPGNFESWGATVSFGALYFTSNRDGKAEIYELINNRAIRVTNTPGDFESWGPIIRGQNVYFTSNRSKQIEVYLLKPQTSLSLDIKGWTGGLEDRFPRPK